MLVLMHSIKLFMDEPLEGGDNYFIRLTCNKIDYKTVDTICISNSTI